MVPYIVVGLLAAGLMEGAHFVHGRRWLCVAAAFGQVAKFVFTWRSSMMSHGIAFKALRTMREMMAEKMARVPMGTIVDTPTGTFKNRFIDNVNQLEDAIAHFMPELPSNVFAPVLAMAIVFAVDWRMGLAGIATIPLGILFYLGMMRGYKEKMARYIASEQAMNATLVEYVNGIQVIKAFGRSASSYGSFSRAVAEYHDSTLAWFRQSWVWMAAGAKLGRALHVAGFAAAGGVAALRRGSSRLPAVHGVHRPFRWASSVACSKFAQAARPDLAYGRLPERGLGLPRGCPSLTAPARSGWSCSGRVRLACLEERVVLLP